MREIKFRGKSVEELVGDTQWITDGYGVCNIDYVDGKEEFYLISPGGDYQVFKDSIGQYTGLKDRNGVEIYEWDIIQITFDTLYAEEPSYTGVVKYNLENDYPAFDLDPWIDCDMNALSWLKSECDPSVQSYEVIGNVFENSNLLKREIAEGKEKHMDNKQEIIKKAMEEATKVFGADPAYFGKEGEEEVERQLNKMGYSLDYFKEK